MTAQTEPYLPEVTEAAIQIGREQVCQDVESFADWLACASSEREDCAYFGPISSHELIAEIVMQDRATIDQVGQAMREIRRRYLEDNQKRVMQIAEKAMQP